MGEQDRHGRHHAIGGGTRTGKRAFANAGENQVVVEGKLMTGGGPFALGRDDPDVGSNDDGGVGKHADAWCADTVVIAD